MTIVYLKSCFDDIDRVDGCGSEGSSGTARDERPIERSVTSHIVSALIMRTQ